MIPLEAEILDPFLPIIHLGVYRLPSYLVLEVHSSSTSSSTWAHRQGRSSNNHLWNVLGRKLCPLIVLPQRDTVILQALEAALGLWEEV